MLKLNTLRRLAQLVAYGDWKNILIAVRWRIPPEVFTRKEVYIYKSSEKETKVAIPQWINFRLADSSETAKIASLGIEERVIRERFCRGDQCFVASDKENIVYVCWIHHGPCYVKEFGYHLECSAHDCYLYGAVTHPQARRQGIYSAALCLLLNQLRRETQTIVTQLVGPQNTIVIKTLAKLGYSYTGMLRYRSILWVKTTCIYDVRLNLKKRSFFLFYPRGVSEVY